MKMISALFEPPHDKTNKMTVRPAKTQISLGIRPVLSESSLCAQWVAKDPIILHADSEGSDQTGQVPRLIWVFPGCTCHFIGFVKRRLIFILLSSSMYSCTFIAAMKLVHYYIWLQVLMFACSHPVTRYINFFMQHFWYIMHDIVHAGKQRILKWGVP